MSGELDKYNIPENAYKAKYRISLSDTDYLQVMHYTNYFRFCERAQQELLENIGYSYSILIHKYGLFIPTVESWGEFKAPVRLDNEIEVYVWIEEIGRKHIKWRYTIYNITSQRIVGNCYTTSVCTDTTLMEAIELPEDMKTKLREYLYKGGE
jgi:acyl-CoA thioester hydrolase